MPLVTITIDDDLHAEVKAEAAHSGRTMSWIVTEALRAWVLRRRAVREAGPVHLPTWPGGLRPGVNLDSNAAVRDLLDEDEGFWR